MVVGRDQAKRVVRLLSCQRRGPHVVGEVNQVVGNSDGRDVGDADEDSWGRRWEGLSNSGRTLQLISGHATYRATPCRHIPRSVTISPVLARHIAIPALIVFSISSFMAFIGLRIPPISLSSSRLSVRVATLLYLDVFSPHLLRVRDFLGIQEYTSCML